MEEALRTKLLATAALTALVDTRIDWNLRSQGETFPAIVLYRIGSAPRMNLAAPSGWNAARVQVDTWGITYAKAKAVADLVGGDDGIFNGFRGVLSGLRVRTFVIDRSANPDRDADKAVHRDRIDLNVWWASE